MTKFLPRWTEVMPVKDCTAVAATKFLFENVVTMFGFPNILIRDQGTYCVNPLIGELIDEFQI